MTKADQSQPSKRLTRRGVLSLAAGFGLSCCGFVLVAGDADARPAACGDVVDSERQEAVEAGNVHVKALWLPVQDRLVIGYRLKGEGVQSGEPPSNGGGGMLFPKPASPQTATEIEGILAVEDLGCSIYEIGPPRAYVVGFKATGLSFKEFAGKETGSGDASGPWSPRLPSGLIHVLAVRRVEGKWVVSPMPGARTSLPDDAVFSKPQVPIELPPNRRATRR